MWCVLWLAIAIWSRNAANTVAAARPTVERWRIVHGMTAAVLCLYVAFHLANHLFGLIGPDAHAAVMKIGRVVYRSRVGEPLLVAAMLFQIGTGLFLAWCWSSAPQGFHRTFQVASGAYLSLYILGHMNSVFIYARAFSVYRPIGISRSEPRPGSFMTPGISACCLTTRSACFLS